MDQHLLLHSPDANCVISITQLCTIPPKAGASVFNPCIWALLWLETELQSGSIFGGEPRQALSLWVPAVPRVTHSSRNSHVLRDKVRSSSRESRFNFERQLIECIFIYDEGFVKQVLYDLWLLVYAVSSLLELAYLSNNV